MISATARDEKIIDKMIQMQHVHHKVFISVSEEPRGGTAPDGAFKGQNQNGEGSFCLEGESRWKRQEYAGE
jgi:hypothetical protein